MSFSISSLSMIVAAAKSVDDLQGMLTDVKGAVSAYKAADSDKIQAAETYLKDSEFREQLIEVIENFVDDDDEDAIIAALNTAADTLYTLIMSFGGDSEADESTGDAE